MVKAKYYGAVLLAPSLMWSAQEHVLSEQQRIEVYVASKELNRIAVQGDRIQQVFGAEGQFTLESDEQSGQIFVKPLDPLSRKPVNLTLVTEGGLTQDLKLVPWEGEAESLLLKSVSSHKTPSSLEVGGSYVDGLLQLVKGTAAGQIDGHTAIHCGDQARAFTPYLTGEPKRCWAGVRYQITEYKITNISANTHDLDEKDLVREGDIALGLGTPQLAPQAATNLIVIRLK